MFRDQAKFSFKRKIHPFISVGLSVMILGSACMSDKKPADVLTEQEMVKMLMEIYLAEEKVEKAGIQYDSMHKIFPRLEAKIYERTNVSDSVFLNSLKYYRSHPKKLEFIYSALVDSLNLKAQRAPSPSAE